MTDVECKSGSTMVCNLCFVNKQYWNVASKGVIEQKQTIWDWWIIPNISQYSLVITLMILIRHSLYLVMTKRKC